MSWIRLKNISKSYERASIFREIHFKLASGDKVGLVGQNGVGKTTLIKLILGQEDPDEGTVGITDGVTIGYFSQFSELDSETTIQAELVALFPEVHALESEMNEVNAGFMDGPDEAEMMRLVDRQAELLEAQERAGSWTYENDIDTVLTKLGFSAEHRELPIGQLSGGWRNRAALAKVLVQQPQVLLMDEPTNYLDIAGLRWLEQWFQKFSGALIVISHDRQFLESVCNRIVEVENRRLYEYDGSFGDYVQKKQMRIKTLEREFAHEGELLAYEQDAISNRKELAKNPSPELRRRLAKVKKSGSPRPVDQIVTEIYQGLHVKDSLCKVTGLGVAFDGHNLFEDLNFDVRRGDRIAILGPNGCGKTTLLTALSGELPPNASGEIDWTSGTTYVSFNQLVDQLDLDDTVGHAVSARPGSLAFHATKKSVNRFLGLFQFSEVDRAKKIGQLSGGEAARVALAQCLLSGASVIILDEPTNHLDMQSTQVMERALAHFPGAVLVVSHDRFFIDKVANRVLRFDGEGGVGELQAGV
ncbi:MAG: ATPase subunit of ABC transporter with duplicated ATPase domains [Candidatus Poriferisodalaceae bacterium]